MNDNEILSHVDHTLLKATSTWEQIVALCDEAVKYGTASVCIPACYVKRVHDKYGDKINVCTVIGFPLGYSTTPVKVLEATDALANGAHEIDMVVNVTDVKNGDFDKVEEEIKAIREAVGSKDILKVIIETCYLTEDEKVRLCQIVTSAGADFIKTSTGFGTAGATHEDILLFKKNIGPKVRIKAAGGIRSREDMVQYLEEGCSRLGTSSAVKMLNK